MVVGLGPPSSTSLPSPEPAPPYPPLLQPTEPTAPVKYPQIPQGLLCFLFFSPSPNPICQRTPPPPVLPSLISRINLFPHLHCIPPAPSHPHPTSCLEIPPGSSLSLFLPSSRPVDGGSLTHRRQTMARLCSELASILCPTSAHPHLFLLPPLACPLQLLLQHTSRGRPASAL